MAAAFTGTVTLKVTNYSGHVATITFSENNGGTVTPTYPSKLYIIGTINGEGWNPDNVAAMTSNDEGVYTIESVTLGENGGSCGFAITGGGATWEDVNSLRFGPATKDTKAVVGSNKVDGVGDVSWTIDPGTYKMVFDYEAKTLTITLVSGGEVTPPTPTYPENVYIIGTINGEGWNPTLGKLMTDEGEGIYTIENVVLKEVDGNTGFSFVTALAENNDEGGWNYINGLRYGPKENDTEATLEQELPFEKIAYSWTIKPGTYTFTLDFNDMILYVEGEADQTDPNPDVELEPFDAMFNFNSYEGMAECVPGLPAESSWTADGTTGNIYYSATKAVVDGVTIEPKAHSGATVSNTPRYYKTSSGVYTLRVYNNNTMTITAPEGGYLSSIVLTAGSSTTATNSQKITADVGTLSFDSRVATWTPTARANVSSVTFTIGTTIQYIGIEVEGEAPEVDEPDVPTPEVPETTWNVNGNYNDDSSWSTPIKFTSYKDGVYSTDVIGKLVEFKLTNEGTWYGYDGEGYAKLGETFKVAAGDQYGNVAFGLSGYVKDAVISFNPETLEVTVTGTWVSTALELYFRGDLNNWGNDGLTDEYKFATEDGNVYTLTLDELSAGSEFKIASANWSPEYTTSNTNMANGTYSINGGTNMALGQPLTNVTLTLDLEKNNLTVDGTVVMPPVKVPSKLYLMGDVNGFAWATNEGIEATNNGWGQFTFENVVVNDSFEGFGFYNFATVLADTDNDWDAVNEGDRFGAIEPDYLLEASEIAGAAAYDNVAYFPAGINSDKCNSFKTPAGTYNMVLCLYDDTNEYYLTLAPVKEPEPVSATVTFKFEDENYKNVTAEYSIVDEVTGEPEDYKPFALESDNVSFTFFDKGSIKITANEGYTVSITTDSELNPGGDTYWIMNEDEAAEIAFFNAEAVNGLVFNVNVEEIPEERPAELRVAILNDMPYNGYNAVVTPNPDDAVLEYDAATETYKGQITLEKGPVNAKYQIAKVYSGTDEVVYYGPFTLTDYTDSANYGRITITSTGASQTFEIRASSEANKAGAFTTFSLPAGADFGTYDITINSDFTSATLTLVSVAAAEKEPELYFFGSTTGGGSYNVREKMTPSTVDPKVFEFTYNVPAVKADKDDEVGGNDGFAFYFSSSSSVAAKGNYGPTTEDEAIEFVYGEKTVEGTWAENFNHAIAMTPGNTKFRFNIETLKFEAEYLDEIPNPKANTIYAEPFEIELDPKNDYAGSVEVPVILEAENFSYRGFQFDVALPAGLKVDAVNVSDELAVLGFKVGFNFTEGVYRVLGYSTTTSEIAGEIVKLTITSTYADNEVAIEEGEYVNEVVFSNVDFSTTNGLDNDAIGGSETTVTVIYTYVPATSVTIDNSYLMLPSWNATFSDEVTSFTQGEELALTVTVTPQPNDDTLVWTSNVDGVTVEETTATYRNAAGETVEITAWVVNADNVPEIAAGESVEVTLTATANEDAYAEITVTVVGVLLGDANDNGEVTVADVVTTANYIVNAPITEFNYPNADVILSDTGITTDDVTAIVNIVMGDFDPATDRYSKARRHTSNFVNNDRLVADNFRAAKAQATLGVNLENSNAYSALQATVIVPEGMTVYGVTAGPRAAAHELVYNMVDGKVYVVLYSLTNASFAEGEGALFNILYTADSNCDELVIEAIHASDARSNGYDLQYEGGLNASATGIGAIEADIENGARYFDVNGYEVRNPEAGQILIRVKGNESTKVLVK